MLDVACGQGRHLRWFASHGHRVTGVDRDASAQASPGALGTIVQADLEGAPWPLPGRTFDAVIVTNYLWRPLWPALRASLAPGGVLIYETFGVGNEAFGRPSNPAYLLQPGELLDAFRDLRIVAYEEGVLTAPARCVQRLAARWSPNQVDEAAPLESGLVSPPLLP